MAENTETIIQGAYVPATTSTTQAAAKSSSGTTGTTTNGGSTTTTGTKILSFPAINERIISSECKCAIALLRFYKINILAGRFVADYLPMGSRNLFDPDLEFGGDPFTAVSRGCNVPVLENALNNFFNMEAPELSANGLRRLSMNALVNNYINKGIPVEIWATDNMEDPIREDPFSHNGKTIRLVTNAHAYILIGYTDTEYHLYDPETNTIVQKEKSVVSSAYGLMGNQSLVIEGESGAYTEPDSGNNSSGSTTTTVPDGAYTEPGNTNLPGSTTTTMVSNFEINIPHIAQLSVAEECKCAVLLLHHNDIKVKLDQFIENYVPRAPMESFDPDLHFGGDPVGLNRGCNAPVMQTALNNYLGKNKYSYRALSLNNVPMSNLQLILNNRKAPVAFWATNGILEPVLGESMYYNEKEITWYKNAQCFLLTGYNKSQYRIFNPKDNRHYYVRKSRVEDVYNQLGRQALIIQKSTTPPETTQVTYTAPNHTPHDPSVECELCNKEEKALVADPVDASTGSHILKNHLLNLFGGQKLTVTAHYNSSKLCSGVLGVGWYHNFEKRIEATENNVLHVYENPSEYITFVAGENSNYYAITNGKEGYVLSQTEEGYCLNCNEDHFEHFDLNGQLTKVVDRHGFEITLTYTDSCITITDTITGKSIFLEKDSTGKVIRVYDETGRETTLTYLNDYLVNIKDVSNCMLTYTYDENGRVETGTDRDDVCYFRNYYDEAGRVVQQLDGNNSTEILSTFTYGEDGVHTSTNRLGKQSTRIFNELGLLIQYVDENGNATTYTYDDAFNVSSITDALGHRTEIVYNRFKKPTRVKDKNGNITDYLYDESGNLLKITHPNGTEETFVYNERNQILQHTDLRGTVTVYTYDENGLLASKKVGSKNAATYQYVNGLLVTETDANGNATHYSYNESNQMISKTDSLGLVTNFEYDLAGNILKATDPNGNSVSYTYDSNYQKTSATDANGNRTWYSYTENMKPSSVQLPDGSVISYAYDAEDRLIEETDQLGNATKTSYDDGGRVVAKEYADGSVETFEYDEANHMVKHTNPKGAVTETIYDANGNALVVIDAEGNETRNQYDAMSRVVRAVNSVAGAVTYEYSAAGDLLSETDAFGNKKTYTYDEFGNRITATDAKGNVTRNTYDGNNNLLTVTDALGHVTTYTYDTLNRVVSVKNAKNATITYGYDAAGRQTTITDAKGNTFTKVYDPNGNVLKVLDAKGNTVTETAYNELNLPSSVTDASGKKTTYVYNALGKVSAVEDSLGNAHQYLYNSRGQNVLVNDPSYNDSTATYDVMGKITRLAGPLGGATEYSYDNLGRMISESTVSGGTVQYSYNALNLKSELKNARGQNRKFFYDAMGRITGYLAEENEVSYTYDENGNVLTVSDRNGTITRTYDALNRVSSCTDTFGNVIQYRYDAVGNLEYLIYPDGSEVHYAYDVNNNLISATDWAGRVTTYTYDENNRVIGVTKPDGSVTTTVYDSKQRVVSTVEKLPDDTIISGFEYEYDEIGRISTEKVLAKNQKMCYTYDEQSRVVKRTVISLSGTTETEETFSYDGAGNVTADNSRTFVYDTNNRLTQYNGNTVTYDEDGNMLSAALNGEETAFCFDSGNRLVSAGGHAYTYNAENVRIRNLCADADTTYVYNTNCKLSQLLCKTTNGITTKYVYGLGLIGEEKENCFKTYHFDFRGSTVAITDANGTLTDTFVYDTYGKLVSRTGTSFVIFGYNGRDGVVTDKNGLIYMRARYYSPELRRFANADIVAGSLDNAVTLNRFAYANGNPVSFVDPFGLSPERKAYPYGAILYNGEEYPIHVPNPEDSDSWKTISEITEDDFSFDWMQFIVGANFDDIQGLANRTSKTVVPSDGMVLSAGLFSIFSALSTSAANSANTTFVTFTFQQNENQKRVIIKAGSSQIKQQFYHFATGFSYSVYSQSSRSTYAMICLNKFYKEKTGNNVGFFSNADIEVTIDKRHKGSPYSSYLWIDNGGTIMETPIIYSGDKVELGTSLFGIFFSPELELVINETSPVAEDYQKLFNKAIKNKP